MRSREFLFELYDRIAFKKKFGRNILLAAKKDPSWRDISKEVQASDPDNLNDRNTFHVLEYVFRSLEAKDETPEKKYLPWVIKVYCKGGVRAEDINLNDVIAAYDHGKKRRLIKPEHLDIYKFNTYQEFLTAMEQYDLDQLFGRKKTTKELPRGQSNELYNDENVRVVIPLDQDAACYYGQWTKWCTAAKTNNAFEDYIDMGKLFIILPKHPNHVGEKYQLFVGGDYTEIGDETNHTPDNPYALFTVRFPGLLEAFRSKGVNLYNDVLFTPNSVIDAIIDEIKDVVHNNFDKWWESFKLHEPSRGSIGSARANLKSLEEYIDMTPQDLRIEMSTDYTRISDIIPFFSQRISLLKVGNYPEISLLVNDINRSIEKINVQSIISRARNQIKGNT